MQEADDSGCTALAALCLPGRVLVANAGDCQCCLWRGQSMVPLNKEHIAADPAERARVEAAGGEVRETSDGKLRVQGVIQVGLGYEQPAPRPLATAVAATTIRPGVGHIADAGAGVTAHQVTRCFGDRPLRKWGLTSEPEVVEVEICESDRALVLASDGLWDVLTAERVMHCLTRKCRHPPTPCRLGVAALGPSGGGKEAQSGTVGPGGLRLMGHCSPARRYGQSAGHDRQAFGPGGDGRGHNRQCHRRGRLLARPLAHDQRRALLLTS